jgi:hypothetical protein
MVTSEDHFIRRMSIVRADKIGVVPLIEGSSHVVFLARHWLKQEHILNALFHESTLRFVVYQLSPHSRKPQPVIDFDLDRVRKFQDPWAGLPPLVDQSESIHPLG